MMTTPSVDVVPLEYRDRLTRHVFSILADVAKERGLLGVECLDSRHKTERHYLAREAVIAELLKTVWWRYGKDNDRDFLILPCDHDAVVRADWRRCSSPVIAGLLGYKNHSSVLVAMKRLREKEKVENG
jgi:hypothetical protein